MEFDADDTCHRVYFLPSRVQVEVDEDDHDDGDDDHDGAYLAGHGDSLQAINELFGRA